MKRFSDKINESLKSINVRSYVVVSRPWGKEDPDNIILMDLLDLVGSIGHELIPFTLDWDDDYNLVWKEYLINVYGPDIKNYKDFLLE